MMLRSVLLLPYLASLAYAIAVPRDSAEVEARATAVTTLSAAQLAAYTPYTQLARAAYCPSSKIKNWGCGGVYFSLIRFSINWSDISCSSLEACKAIPGFQPTVTGGDGNDVQLCMSPPSIS